MSTPQIFTAALLLAASTPTLTAQPEQDSDSSAERLGTVTAVVGFPSALDLSGAVDLIGPTDGETGCSVVEEGLVWSTPEGPVITGLAETIVAAGLCPPLDSLSTSALFDQLSGDLVRRAIGEGLIACDTSCGAPTIVRVDQPAYVSVTPRAGGEGFEACGSDVCSRVYSVCCSPPDGAPTINLISVTCPGCAGVPGTCRVTCGSQ